MPEIKWYKISEPYLNLKCGLGEAPFWEKSLNSLRFVDIVKKKVHFVDLAKGPSSHRQLDLDFNVGTTADIEGNAKEFIFGGKYGYGVLNRETGESKWIQKMWTDEERKDDGGGKPKQGKNREERMRSNDGAVDAKGRYFVGAMNDPALVGQNLSDEGILFRLDPDLSIHRLKAGVTIPNGMSWSPDHKSFYFTDSPSRSIIKYPYDLATGHDEEGCFWIALFGAGKVVRVDLDGEIIAQVALPTRCVTCPAFAGTQLFVTTAEEEEPERFAWSTEFAGALFRVDVGVRGRPLHAFRFERAVE